MADLSGFDANAPENNEGNVLPAGEYRCVAVASEMKPTKNGDGEYLSMDFQILDGPHQNKHIFHKFNLKNKNEDAVKIARGQLSSLCRAVNVATPKDSSELHGKPVFVRLNVKNSDDYGPQNNIVQFKPAAIGQAKPQIAMSSAAPAAQSANPW